MLILLCWLEQSFIFIFTSKNKMPFANIISKNDMFDPEHKSLNVVVMDEFPEPTGEDHEGITFADNGGNFAPEIAECRTMAELFSLCGVIAESIVAYITIHRTAANARSSDMVLECLQHAIDQLMAFDRADTNPIRFRMAKLVAQALFNLHNELQ